MEIPTDIIVFLRVSHLAVLANRVIYPVVFGLALPMTVPLGRWLLI
jgi:hypothetical protein